MGNNLTCGIVEAISQKEKGYAVLIKENWYNGFGKCPVAKGDEVTIDWEERNRFKSISEIKINKKAPETESNKVRENEEMLRMAARRNALAYVHNKLLAHSLKIEDFRIDNLTLHEYTEAVEKREYSKLKGDTNS